MTVRASAHDDAKSLSRPDWMILKLLLFDIQRIFTNGLLYFFVFLGQLLFQSSDKMFSVVLPHSIRSSVYFPPPTESIAFL